MSQQYVIGADIGGTHITAALVDLARHRMLPETLIREKVDSGAAATAIIETWGRAIRLAKGSRSIHQVSLAMPGPVDYEQGICLIRGQEKYEQLYGMNIKHLLADELGIPSANIFMDNDAASFLQGEVFGGVAKDARSAIGVTLGTGLGSALYADGRATSCDLWNMPFGGHIVEDYLSTRWFVKRCKELGGGSVTGVSELKMLPNAKLLEQIFDEFGTNLGKFLLAFIAGTLPEVVVLGGNISRSYALFKENVLRQVQSIYPTVSIRTAGLGEEAALLGAASHWKPSGQAR
ncbi:ROK family protein [Hufsiella ginkgonis]|uniref:ROK family protein n=1 Tax=Hufsiella ginkgonis TaxID=2695274 RepID=A0A7K1XWP2_9SPHI|nr:ROK family protein [Hufsiella ginkgonis]MXV15424.1 ROK family protein [Hufsiella ginkgonis]